MINDKSRVTDGFLSLEGGVDSGFVPSLIDANQLAFAVNTTVRGGWPTSRPGWKRIPVDFASHDGSTGTYFQGAGSFTDRDENSQICYSMGGRLWSVNVTGKFALAEFTPTGNTNNTTGAHAWFQEAENAMVVQDNDSPATILAGPVSRRATAGEVPIGGPMAYGKGRLWVAKKNTYVGGDLVWSDPGLLRDSIFKFSENTFLAEGGEFAVPGGGVTGMSFAANLDTSLGEGDLLVFTATNVFAFSAPVDRTQWKDLQYPIQRFALLDYGGMNHESIVKVNGDLIFRSQDGVRSLIYARRDFTEWGNTPVSRQVRRVLQYDSENLLYAASAVNFDNRMLMTTQPVLDRTYGVWHRGLVVLDYDLVSGMGKKVAPAWEGAWTGLRVLQLVTVRVNNVRRCFMFALGGDNHLQLWEMTKADLMDNDNQTLIPISRILETRSMSCASPASAKDLIGADLFFDQLAGNVQATVRYRRDNSELWWKWGAFTDSAEYFPCNGTDYPNCQQIAYWRKQTRTRVGMPKPQSCNDVENGGMSTNGYEFQLRFEFRGKLRLKRLILNCTMNPDALYKPTPSFICSPCDRNFCENPVAAIQSCDLPDYGYQARTLVVLGTDIIPIDTDDGTFILID